MPVTLRIEQIVVTIAALQVILSKRVIELMQEEIPLLDRPIRTHVTHVFLLFRCDHHFIERHTVQLNGRGGLLSGGVFVFFVRALGCVLAMQHLVLLQRERIRRVVLAVATLARIRVGTMVDEMLFHTLDLGRLVRTNEAIVDGVGALDAKVVLLSVGVLHGHRLDHAVRRLEFGARLVRERDELYLAELLLFDGCERHTRQIHGGRRGANHLTVLQVARCGSHAPDGREHHDAGAILLQLLQCFVSQRHVG